MDLILNEATAAIKDYPYNFLYTSEVQKAFRALNQGIEERTEETDTLAVTIPAVKIKDRTKLQMLPLPVTEGDGSDSIGFFSFDWFTIPEDKTGFADVAMQFVTALVNALDALPEDKQLSPDEIKTVKEKYAPGTKIRIIKMHDDHAPEAGSEYEVDLVDDCGQIHVKGLGLALIPGVDEFEVIE